MIFAGVFLTSFALGLITIYTMWKLYRPNKVLSKTKLFLLAGFWGLFTAVMNHVSGVFK